jgi:imidazolonepropionase-like amidohydrolase
VDDVAITNGTVINLRTGDAMSDAIVLIRDGRIVQVGRGPDVGLPDGTRTFDAGGGWILPGLINLHGHFSLDGGPAPVESMEDETELFTAMRATSHARQALLAGVTTVRELGSRAGLAIELRDATVLRHISGPRIFASGLVITMTGGHGWYIGREVDGPEAMRKAIREQIRRGVDLIKIMATGGVARPGEKAQAKGLTVAEMRAAVDEAHRADVRTTAHALTDEGVKDAVEAGLDCIEHGIILSDATVALMRERDVPLVSTLSVHQALFRTAPGDPHLDAYKERARNLPSMRRASFQRAVAAGVRIGAGSDAGTVLNPHDNFVMELEQMVDAGLSAIDALRAATTWAAEILGTSDLGEIQEGHHGDLIVTETDPREDIQALRQLVMVIKDGELMIDHRTAGVSQADLVPAGLAN